MSQNTWVLAAVRAASVALAATVCVLALFAVEAEAGARSDIEIMTWVPPYAVEECQAVVEADFGECDAEDGLTRVGLQFWIPNWDGTISYQNLGPWGNPGDADVVWWRDWCTANGIECLLCIYNNDGSEWDWDLARAAFDDNRAAFIAALIAEMERHNLDGIDLDLEGIGSLNGDRAAFDQFVHDLWVELDARGKILTIDTFYYIWNAPNIDWWCDWLGEVDNIHAMGYDDLYEDGTGYQQYSFQQDAGYAAGYPGTAVLMGMPGWLASWGTSAGYGTSAQAHIQEVRYLLTEPTGIAIWDLQFQAWQDSDLWCEIVALRESGSISPPVGLWNFDTLADLTQADVGNDLVLVGSHAYVEGTEPGDGAARIGSGSHYICDHDIPANGGGTSVNEYTVVMDIKTFGRGLWHCFLQTNPSNSDDGEVFSNYPGRVGVSATGYSYPRMLDAKTWYRIAIVVDNGDRFEIYVDGIRILDGTTQSVDGRFSLDPTALLFADNDGEDRQLDVSRVALYEEALSAGEIETLGGLGGMTHFVTRPFLQNVKRDGISIMWETEELETAYVEYGANPSYGSTESASSVDSGHGTRIYTAVLTDLSPESTYHYRAVSGPSATEDATFSSAPDGHVSFSFGVWSDSQGYNWVDESDPTEPTKAMLDHMVGEGIDIAVSCGDLAEDGGSYEDTRVFYVDRPVAHVGGQGVPFFNAWGNHDDGSSGVMRKFADMPSKDRGAPFHAGYGSFSFDYGGCHFVCIDYLCESSDIPGWVEQDLQSVEAQNAKFTFLFVHRPPYCERWYNGQANLRDDLVPLMEEYGVDVCFSGHTHAYGRGYLNGVYYCITGGGSWLDHGEPLVYDWPHMTVGGYHDVAPDIEGGLINEYMKVEVDGATMTARMMAFHPDGTFREVLDTFSKDTDLPEDWSVAAFSGTPVSGDAPLTVTFTDESTNVPTSWDWDFGDDTTSGDQNPIHTYTSDGTYTVSLTATNDAGSDTETKSAYVTVGDGLFCYWALDEGSDDVAYDSAGGNDGTLHGPTWISGQIGHGLSFDGLDDYVEIGASDLSGSWTAAMWVNRSADRSASALLGSSAGALKLEQWPDTHQVGVTDYSGGDYNFAYSTPIGEWAYLAFVCDGTKTLLYVNGAITDSLAVAIAMPLGRIGHGVAYADPPAASLDEVRVYSRALVGAEIYALWEGATGVADAGDDLAMSGRPRLSQNYPNPFNPTTTFAYTLPVDCRVEFSVYNVHGQLVASLVNEIQTAGPKTVSWSAEDCSSGIYFYRLTVGGETLMGEAVLLK